MPLNSIRFSFQVEERFLNVMTRQGKEVNPKPKLHARSLVRAKYLIRSMSRAAQRVSELTNATNLPTVPWGGSPLFRIVLSMSSVARRLTIAPPVMPLLPLRVLLLIALCPPFQMPPPRMGAAGEAAA